MGETAGEKRIPMTWITGFSAVYILVHRSMHRTGRNSLASLVVVLGSAAGFAQPVSAACGNRTVAILVDPAVVNSIRSSLSQFEADLCVAGYNPLENSARFADPAAVRVYLKQIYDEPGRNLVGAILVGNLPRAYQWVTLVSTNPNIPSESEEAISFQYYSDLDGTFAKSPGYVSRGGRSHSYDIHSGDTGWEIWVGVLPYYKGNLAQTVDALNRYFAKNHAYRTGQLARPRAFLEISEFFRATTLAEHNLITNDLRSGIYSWTPYSNGPNARLYFDSPPGGLSVAQGYADMGAGAADFTVTDTHGNWFASGQLTIPSIEASPVRTIFFWSSGCAIGDLDRPDNFLTSILYSPTSDVLVAKGTTNNSGGMGNNPNGFYGHNIAAALTLGASFGEAILRHVNVPLIWPWSSSREFHFGTPVTLGDPTLSPPRPIASVLALVSGNSQTGVVGRSLPNPLVVRAMDAGGLGAPGIAVAFEVTSGTARLSAASVVTGVDGTASVGVTLGPTPGRITITATALGLPPLTFAVTATEAPPPAPRINSGGVVGAGLSFPPVRSISPNSIISIFGENFAPLGTMRLVGSADLVNGRLPTRFGDVCVQIGSQLAAIFHVFPGQVNVQAPNVPPGNAQVQVIAGCQSANEVRSNIQTVNVQAATPEFFYFLRNADGRNPIAATNAVTGAFIGASGLIAGADFVPAKPGDILTLYATGLGVTNPAFATGELPGGIGSTVGLVTVNLGGANVAAGNVLYAGVAPFLAGVYQVNLRVPDAAPDGDLQVVLRVGGIPTPPGAFLTVKR